MAEPGHIAFPVSLGNEVTVASVAESWFPSKNSGAVGDATQISPSVLDSLCMSFDINKR